MIVPTSLMRAASFVPKYVDASRTIWAIRDGHRPLDVPVCGFSGRACPLPFIQRYLGIVISGGVLVTISSFIIVAVLTLIAWSRMKVQRMAMKQWQIPFNNLKKQIQGAAQSSVRSLLSNASGSVITRLTNESAVAALTNVYFLNNETVFTRKHAGRATIQKKEISEMLSGLDAIHNSILGYHGHLTSKNCLLDDRWLTKISDYGLRTIRMADKREKKGSTSAFILSTIKVALTDVCQMRTDIPPKIQKFAPRYLRNRAAVSHFFLE
ncbi:unnamed protein product [Gongylonema pulchrum]|uniref:Guanylate cyclase n=1 Tax=Gongylonema pulchrum TaxID=637853 RepID=A0A183CX32_9BILA|nr:unnamed protein product [Gongylonema pulchrum]